MRTEVVSLLVIALCFLGCAAAYDRTYDQELGRLRNQERQRQDAEAANRAEAQNYVAVVYFGVGSAMIQEEGYHELLWFADKIAPVRNQARIDVKGHPREVDTDGSDTLSVEEIVEAFNESSSSGSSRRRRRPDTGLALERFSSP